MEISVNNVPKILKLILVDNNIRITSAQFKVYIPSIMPLVEKGAAKDTVTASDLSRLGCKSNMVTGKLNECNYIIAKSIHPYRYSHGTGETEKLTIKVPDSKIEKISGSKFKNSSTSGETQPAGEGPHTHGIKKPLLANDYEEFRNDTKNQTIPLMYNFNAIWINEGHVLYGFYVDGSDNEVVVTAIDGVVPYHD